MRAVINKIVLWADSQPEGFTRTVFISFLFACAEILLKKKLMEIFAKHFCLHLVY